MGSSNGRQPKYVWLEKKMYDDMRRALCDTYDYLLENSPLLYGDYHDKSVLTRLFNAVVHCAGDAYLFNPQDEPTLDAVAAGEKMEAGVTVRNIFVCRERSEDFLGVE